MRITAHYGPISPGLPPSTGKAVDARLPPRQPDGNLVGNTARHADGKAFSPSQMQGAELAAGFETLKRVPQGLVENNHRAIREYNNNMLLERRGEIETMLGVDYYA